MQHNRNGEKADGLDRLADLHLVAVDREAGLFHGVGDIAGAHRTIELAAVAGLADQDELLAVQLLAGLLGFALQAFEVVGFQLRLLALEIFPVRLGGAQGLLLGQQEVAGKAVA